MKSEAHILLSCSAEDLQLKLLHGETTSTELVNVFLEQIECHNRRGMGLNAVISACPRPVALELAERLDEERQKGQLRSKLHGIPIIVKV